MQQQGQLAAGPHLTPPRTLGAVVRQARDAFRRYRQDTAAARQGPAPDASAGAPQSAAGVQQTQAAAVPVQQPSVLQQQQQHQQQADVQQPLLQGVTRLRLQLPLPVASTAPPGTSLLDQPFSLFDEGDWPGGIVQRFRALRPLVDATLEGYDPQFLGMLEDPADGMGCWSLGPDTTLVGLVTNATFANFAKLCQGGYGSRPLQAGHTMVAINPDWTGPQDIGQFWERKLKAAAEDVLSSPWDTLYSCQILRTSRGKGFGLLVCSYGLGWHLWSADEESSSSVRDQCLLWRPSTPDQSEIVAAVNEAARVSTAGRQPGGLSGLLGQWKRPGQE